MGRLKSRMQRNADLQVNQIDDIFAKKIVDAYIESIVDEFKKSKYIEQIPEERTEEFYDFIKDRVGTYRSINEFDFLINPFLVTKIRPPAICVKPLLKVIYELPV